MWPKNTYINELRAAKTKQASLNSQSGKLRTLLANIAIATGVDTSGSPSGFVATSFDYQGVLRWTWGSSHTSYAISNVHVGTYVCTSFPHCLGYKTGII